jgi:hypothetical protein
MNPKPFSELNHFTVPCATTSPQQVPMYLPAAGRDGNGRFLHGDFSGLPGVIENNDL